MGYLGAAMATSLLYLLRTAVLLVYMQYTGVCPLLPAQISLYPLHSAITASICLRTTRCFQLTHQDLAC